MDPEAAVEHIDPIRFTVTVERGESRRFVAHSFARAPNVAWLAYGVTFCAVASVLGARDLIGDDYAHGVFELVLAAIIIIYLVRFVRETYARVLKRGGQAVTYAFSEDGVACEGANSTWWLPWRSVTGYVRRPDGYYFMFGGSYVPVPLRAIPAGRAMAFVTLVNRRARRIVR